MSKRNVVAGGVAALIIGAGAGALAGTLTSSTHATSVAVTVSAHAVPVHTVTVVTTVSAPAPTVTAALSTSGTTIKTSAGSTSTACPPGRVESRSYNATRGKCVKPGYVRNTSTTYTNGMLTTVTNSSADFVDPHGVECFRAFVRHGYCHAP